LSGQSRETDVVARLQREVEKVLVRLSVVAECKGSRDKPWVLFTTANRLTTKASVAQRTASRFGRLLLMQLMDDPTIGILPLFALPQRTGYGVTQAFTSGKDVAYEACVSVTSAAVAQAKEADVASKRGRAIAEIVFPVVVVDGKLLEAFLSDSGEVLVHETESGVLVWRNPLGNVVHTMIHIITASFLNAFVSGAAGTGHAVLQHEEAVKRLGSTKPDTAA
jgi:hypothetical protein